MACAAEGWSKGVRRRIQGSVVEVIGERAAALRSGVISRSKTQSRATFLCGSPQAKPVQSGDSWRITFSARFKRPELLVASHVSCWTRGDDVGEATRPPRLCGAASAESR